jgi:hypothetical protein
MTEQPAELCAVCQEPASEDRGELVSAIGTAPNSPNTQPRIQRVHAGCRQHINRTRRS